MTKIHAIHWHISIQGSMVNARLVLLFPECLNLTMTLIEALSRVNEKTCATVPQNVTFVTPVMKLTLLEECSSKIQNESVIDPYFAARKTRSLK